MNFRLETFTMNYKSLVKNPSVLSNWKKKIVLLHKRNFTWLRNTISIPRIVLHPTFFNPYLLFFVFHPHHTKLSPFCVTPLGEGWGCGIVTAICNCRPFAIVVAILATVACSLRPPNSPPLQQEPVFH